MWDLNPLIEQVKQFNQTQALILQELKEIKEHLSKCPCKSHIYLLSKNAINSKT
ncbi:MAG: hypothetical protein I3270_02585 [Candidatus Moeniiplasma glomeromycotorum]|nr:hypothetical protein [Candidatus Moeniiplasma glomeromycotorum]MCE8162566.1 hypothetical protein [Candidatus Moeniiplasma glomeromycotorum]MCE8166510.1 hypothetical protein [Candidatus Moeniiplasma glomeromycotorum]MCE8166949.1 hypothetical protein [Candidatus Moeniiplasma glomeromycotorum]